MLAWYHTSMEQGVTVDETCDIQAMTPADYARLCTEQGNDMVLYVVVGSIIAFIVLVGVILFARRR